MGPSGALLLISSIFLGVFFVPPRRLLQSAAELEGTFQTVQQWVPVDHLLPWPGSLSVGGGAGMGTPVLQIPRGPSPTQSPDLIPSQHCVLIHLHADGVLGLCGGCAGAQVGATVPAASRGPPSPNTWQDGGQAEGCLAMFPPSSLLLQGQFCCHDLFLHGRGRPGAVDPPPAGAAGTEGVLFSEQSGMGGGGGWGGQTRMDHIPHPRVSTHPKPVLHQYWG